MTAMTDLYAARIADGTLQADAAQQAVLPEFDRIQTALNHPTKTAYFRPPQNPPTGPYR